MNNIYNCIFSNQLPANGISQPGNPKVVLINGWKLIYEFIYLLTINKAISHNLEVFFSTLRH